MTTDPATVFARAWNGPRAKEPTMRFNRLAAAVILVGLTSCTLNDQGITSSADNYVRLTEYNASVPLYGGVSGCQLSTQGDVSATYTLETENCSVSVQGNEQ